MNTNSDFATVISICPFPIHEFKPGLIPATFSIAKAIEGDIEVLTVGNKVFARQRVPILGNILEIPVPAVKVAEAIVADRLTGQLLVSEGSRPGLFWVPGEYSKEEAKQHFQVQIDACRITQKQWFLDLIAMADDDWNKTHQHRFISDLQRYAAKVLQIDRPWRLETVDSVSGKNCVACYSQIHILASICPICKTDQEEFAALAKEKAAQRAAPKAEVPKPPAVVKA